MQWQIQDFPKVGAPTPKVDVKSYYLVDFPPQNCMKLKEFGLRGCVPGAPLDPPMNMELILANIRWMNASAFLVTGRNEVLTKVIFSQACVILSTGGGVWSRGGSPNFQGGSSKFSGGVPPNFGGVPPKFQGGFLQIFGGGSPPENGQRSAGTHPTGMHSCFGQCKWYIYLQ